MLLLMLLLFLMDLEEGYEQINNNEKRSNGFRLIEL